MPPRVASDGTRRQRSVAFPRTAAHRGSRYLQSSAVEPRTLKRYSSAVDGFTAWLTSVGSPSVPLAALDGARVDSLLSDYIHELYYQCSSLARASATVFGLELLDARLKGHLHLSKLALRGWRRLTPGRSYPPLTWDAACFIALALVAMGERRAAIATLVMFDCYLRVGEMASLRMCDVVDSSSSRMGSAYVGMAVILPRTKTGRNQSVDLRRPIVKTLLADLLLSAGDYDSPASVFGLSADRYRRLFKRATAMLGLSSDYVPHSLRHGGATFDYLNRVPMADVVLRGRWASLRTASRYVQAGKAMLAARTHVPLIIRRHGAAISSTTSLRCIFKIGLGPSPQ
jgi:integrase